MKNLSIPCELHSVTFNNGQVSTNKIASARIIGKSLFKSNLIDNIPFYNDSNLDEYLFDYSYNIPIDKTVSISGNEKKLNTKITYTIINDNNSYKQICYTHLTCKQRILLSFRFKKLWWQQSKNIMWLVNILVALLAILATLATILY